ncbi:diacylglycerol/lipid kinase family protein [Rubripirellula tenax]|nr:diacylglycerol kinase family protein [Rubripirellula tenax]
MDRLDRSNQASVIVFTSPKAGSGAGREELPRLTAELARIGVAVQTVASVNELKRAVSHFDHPVVVAAGGDGTLALAAESIDETVPLVPMPMGTENLLARHFGHSRDAHAVIETLRFGGPQQIDVGSAAGKPFLIMATCGFDADVVRGMHLTRRGHINRFSYFRPIIRSLRTYTFPEIEIRVDNGPPILAGWAMVFNLPRYAASLSIEPDAVPDDGMLDLIALKGRSIASGIRYLAGIQTGSHLNFSDVVRCRGKQFDIRAVNPTDGRIAYQVDGDYGGRLPLKIETKVGRTRLLLPATGELPRSARSSKIDT